jgi:hypothetical protein
MPAIDWFQTFLLPWVHFMPVSSDMSDLEERWQWAEANPEEAQRIAAAGAEVGRNVPPRSASEDFAAALEAARVSPILEGVGKRLSHCHHGVCAGKEGKLDGCRDFVDK